MKSLKEEIFIDLHAFFNMKGARYDNPFLIDFFENSLIYWEKFSYYMQSTKI